MPRAGIKPRGEADFGEAVTLQKNGRPAAAAEKYSAVLAADGRHFGALRNLGLLQLGAGQYGAATALLRRAVQLKPEHAATHCDLASALHSGGAIAEAIAHYQRAIELDPRDATAHNDLGIALRDACRRRHRP